MTTAPTGPQWHRHATALSLVTYTGPDVVTVQPAGEIDMSSQPDLEAATEQAMAGRPDRLVLDLRAIGFCAVTGVAILVRVRAQCRRAGIELQLVPSRTVRRALDVAGVGSLFRLIAL